jgi:hypothetical protein
MTQNTAIGLVVAVVVGLGGEYYLMHQDAVSKPETGDQKSASTTALADTTQAGKFKGSFTELAARGGSWKCTVDTSTAQSISSGVTYVSAGKVRGDFTTSVQGYGSVESHVMADGQDVYTWSSMMPQGLKVKMTAQGSGGTVASGQGADANQAYSYDCQPWVADATLFTLPASVTFKTIGQ